MSHDVYICYDEEETNLCDAVYDAFEKNGITPWAKSRDMESGESVNRKTDAIAESKCFVLILSESSQKRNYTITEADIAFSRNIPILVYKVDEAKVAGNLGFILENQTMINSYPNSRKQLERLVEKTFEIIKKPAGKVEVDSGSVDVFEAINPKKGENRVKKILAVAVPAAVIVILIYLFAIVPMGQNTTGDGVFSMNMTEVKVANTHYAVYGESYNLPGDADKYLMNIRFFDKNDYMVFEVNSTADEFKHGIMWQGDLPTDNVTHVDFKLIDLNNKVLSRGEYKI